MTSKATVLFVSHTSKLNGAERSLLTLVIKLNSLGNIKPVVLVPKNGPLVVKLENNGIQVIKTNYFHWIGRSFLYRLFIGPVKIFLNMLQSVRLRKTIKEIDPQFIYCNTAANPFGAMLAILYNIPYLWHIREFIHEDMDYDFDTGTYLAVCLMKKAKFIVCNSQAILDKWDKHLDSNKLTVIYNGFNFVGLQENEQQKYQRTVKKNTSISLAIIGTISPHKGQNDAIQALSLLLKNGFDVTLTIAGSGRKIYLYELKKFVKTLGLEDKIIWEGFVDDPSEVYKNAAITLVCSRHEAFGRVAVESMGLGTPVIVSDTAGLPEIVNQGDCGLLYKFGDFNALAEQIKKLLSNEQLYFTNSAKGRKSVVERFNIDRYVLDIESLLVGALKQTNLE